MEPALNRQTSLGIVQLASLVVIAIFVLGGLIAFSPKSDSGSGTKLAVLKSDDEEDSSDNSGPGSTSSDDDQDDNDEDIDEIENEVEDEDEDEFDELEFEEAEEEELEEATLAGKRRRIEVRIENGKKIVKIKTVVNGVEREEELEIREGEGIVTLKVEQGGVEQKVRVRLENGQFIIDQEGVNLASTTLPLSIDAQTNTITVQTSLGPISLGQLPVDATNNVLSAQSLDSIISTELDENEKGKTGEARLVYRVNGFSEERFLGLIRVALERTVLVSAQTGEVITVEQPLISRILDFLSIE